MENAAIVAFTEIQTDHRFDVFDHGATHVPSTHGIGGLVHESVNKTGDEELSVEVLGLNRARFAFDAEDHGFAVFLVELHHFAQDRVTNNRLDDGLGGRHGDGTLLGVNIADNG